MAHQTDGVGETVLVLNAIPHDSSTKQVPNPDDQPALSGNSSSGFTSGPAGGCAR